MKAIISLIACTSLVGCASYTTPGGPVSIPAITEVDIAEVLSREPAAEFPAELIVARVQAANYVSKSSQGYGSGSYTVLTARDFETEADFDRIGAMPSVASVGPLSRLLLPARLNTTRELRTAAAQLRGDVLLLYTVDTSFWTDTIRIGPLQAVSLGFFPNKNAQVTATCAAMFIDVRTGYVYGIAEGTATETQRSNAWSTRGAIEEARIEAERQAFAAALTEVEDVWSGVVAHYAPATQAATRP